MTTDITTLCYIERGGQYLMLHRTKKEHDINRDKWIGIGGKLEAFESPEECLLREVKEETGLDLTSYRRRGIITFCNDKYFEYMFLYTADGFTGNIKNADACDEGVLEWIDKEKVLGLPLWEGDQIFLKKLAEDAPYFSLKLIYHGDQLLSHQFF